MACKKKNIYILLTNFHDGGSKLLHFITGTKYTHASIGFEEDINTFYSFVYKGFLVEKISKYIKPSTRSCDCCLYRLSVRKRVYNAAKRAVEIFVNLKNRLKYTKFGVVMCVMKIPYKKNSCYFCSQFVADILKKSKAAKLEKESALYLPSDFESIDGIQLNFQGSLHSFARHYGISDAAA